MVLATTEYRRAYGGKLSRVLARVLDSGHVVWIGFSFADQRVAAILREIGDASGTRSDPGQASRHVAVMPWDPGDGGREASDPETLRTLIQIQFGCEAILYPVVGGDHSSLGLLLESLTAPRFPAARAQAVDVARVPVASRSDEAHASRAPTVAVRWVHGGVPVPLFVGRNEELARLDRWADDPEVRLVGVTAWGGSGKTSLVTQWLLNRGSEDSPHAARGMFAWSFYEDASVSRWCRALLRWAREDLGIALGSGSHERQIMTVLRTAPVLLLLDGLEVMQEGPAGTQFGRLLDGMLRTVLTAACQAPHDGLVLLTSRFPFADIEPFDGGPARMLDVPPFTPDEGAALLEQTGVDWLSEPERRELVDAVDGHALAVAVIAGMLADRPEPGETRALLAALRTAHSTDARVGRVLRFYADCLNEADRQLVAIVSLFQRPVTTAAILTLGKEDSLRAPLSGWSAADVEQAVRQRLSGLLTWHSGSTVSAHPLVRDAFRPLVLTGATAQRASSIALVDLPDGVVRSREDGLRVVEMIELLLEADEWEAAHELSRARTREGKVFKHLPAVKLGERTAFAFVATEQRREACRARLSEDRLGFFLNEVGVHALNGGDPVTGERFFRAVQEHLPGFDEDGTLEVLYRNLAECRLTVGDMSGGLDAAQEAFRRTTHSLSVVNAHCRLAMALDLNGETSDAERHFMLADRAQMQLPGEAGSHLYSGRGCEWGRLLIRTGRAAAARQLNEMNRELCESQGWNEDVARCDHVLGLCDLADDEVEAARARLDRASETCRDGDALLGYARVLPDVAEQRRRSGDLDAAERHCIEAMTLAAPRRLVGVQAAALVVRAELWADRFERDGDRDALERAQDAAEHVLRLSTKLHRLPWLELAGLDAYARLDRLSERDGPWAGQARERRAALVPPGLDADPLAVTEAEGSAP